MAYTKFHEAWENSPSTATPVSAAALDHIEQGISNASSTADGAAPASHTHVAADVTSGTFTAARIPDIAQSKVTGLEARLTAIEGRLTALEAPETP